MNAKIIFSALLLALPASLALGETQYSNPEQYYDPENDPGEKPYGQNQDHDRKGREQVKGQERGRQEYPGSMPDQERQPDKNQK